MLETLSNTLFHDIADFIFRFHIRNANNTSVTSMLFLPFQEISCVVHLTFFNNYNLTIAKFVI